MAELASSMTVETLLNTWNSQFPNNQLTVDDLKKPTSMINAVFQIFDSLGIDKDAMLTPPNEKNINANCEYYWDLLPVINTTRVANHLLNDQAIKMGHFLQPAVHSSRWILLLMFNLLQFYQERLIDIAPHEKELFDAADQVKELEETKNKLFEMLNRQAEEKAKRGERMEQMEQEIRQLEEELKAEELARDQVRQELDAIRKENNATDVLLDQKRTIKEGLLAERERKRALRVYDADDIRNQAAQAAQNVQEAEEKLHSLQAIIAEKENSLKTLQIIQPNLEAANNLLHDIEKLSENEQGDLEADGAEGELEVLKSELSDLRAQEADLLTRRTEAGRRRQEAQARRQQEKTLAESAVRDAEEEDKKRREFITKATQRTQEIKEQTFEYEKQQNQGYETISQLEKNYYDEIKAFEEGLMKMMVDVKTDIESKLNNTSM